MIDKGRYYNGIWSCGHEGSIRLYFKGKEAREYADEQFAKGICPECSRKQFIEEQAKKAEKIEKEMKAKGLPQLTGTEKQVAWAENIRKEKLEEIEIAYADEKLRIQRIKWIRDDYNRLYEDTGKLKKADVKKYLEDYKIIDQIKQESKATFWINNRKNNLLELDYLIQALQD